MFRAIKFEVTFPTTGRTFKQDLKLDTGLTAIVGSNESGKSLILEMLRYALFGSVALRGSADDYKTLSVECGFEIRGEVYTVTRSARKAELQGPVKASGTTPVNEAIVRLLGFGLAVFDMSCSINQDEVQRLGSLRPAQRKQLVDSVLGIEALDIVSKWAMDEARLLERQAESVVLVRPTAPEKPEGYEFARTIDPSLYQEQASLKTLVSAPISKPVRPEMRVTQTEEELLTAVQQLEQHEAAQRLLASLPQELPVITATVEEWDAYEAYQRAQTWLKANPKPTVDAEALLADHDVCDLLDRLHRAREKGSLTCPHCQGDVPHEHDTIEKIVKELGGRTAVRPTLSRAELQRIKAYDASEHESVPPAPQPTMTRAEIAAAQTQVTLFQQRAQVVVPPKPDIDARSLLADLRHQKRLFDEYERLLVTYGEWAQKVEAAEKRLAEIGELPDIQQVYKAKAYDQDLARYEAALLTYHEQLELVEGLKADAAEHRKVKETLQILRTLIKQHLLPSLNKVASRLLSDMTGGQRSTILVDDDFEVTIDGQALETLSGSGKACANLAIRIALGQVLTNRVFSCLLADEIDSSMDQFRSEQTSNLLEHLQKHISQVLLVTHKSIEAPMLIDLGVTLGLHTGRTEEAA